MTPAPPGEASTQQTVPGPRVSERLGCLLQAPDVFDFGGESLANVGDIHGWFPPLAPNHSSIAPIG